MREGIDVANDVRKIYYWQKSVEISKGLSKDINHRADNTMEKKQNKTTTQTILIQTTTQLLLHQSVTVKSQEHRKPECVNRN